jgi:hypothetical protein
MQWLTYCSGREGDSLLAGSKGHFGTASRYVILRGFTRILSVEIVMMRFETDVCFLAGVIHGDFERGFIKAEVVAYQDFHDLCNGEKSMAPIKAAGKYRQEGKTYVVQDGDIIHFQFSKYPATLFIVSFCFGS